MSDFVSIQAVIALARDIVVPTNKGEYRHRCIDPYDVYELQPADVEPVVRCKDCYFFETDHFEIVCGVPLIVAHNICTRLVEGFKTAEDGYCFMGIRSREARMDGEDNA